MWRSLGAVLLCALASGACNARPSPISSRVISSPSPQSESAETKPLDVASLVRQVRRDESWIDQVQSFQITLEDHWHRTPDGVKERIAELKKQFPEMPVDEKTFPELKPAENGTLELAFDPHRLFKMAQSDGEEVENLVYWDGHTAAAHERYSSGQDGYAFDNKPDRFIAGNFLSDLPWLRTEFHPFWWHAKEGEPGVATSFGLPEDFHLAARKVFRGHDCYVLEDEVPATSLYVGVADQRLYGLEERTEPKSAEVESKVQAIWLKLAAESGHPEVSNEAELNKWIGTFSQTQYDRIHRQIEQRTRQFQIPWVTHWYERYQEISTGRWMPMFMGYDLWNDDPAPVVTSTRELKVTGVSVNRPLADDLFTMPMKEDVQVCDWGHDPPLIYKYKKNMTAAQWDKVLADARQRKQDEIARQQGEDAAIGKPAPPFGQSQWLNSKPLTWAELKGKVVILDFFAEWCGPCRNDLPAAVEINKNQQTTGIVLVGMHPPGSEISKIQKLMKEFGITYPVYIDQPPPKDVEAFGMIFSQFGVRAIPDSVLVDVNGTVVAHGSLREMNARGRELAAKGP